MRYLTTAALFALTLLIATCGGGTKAEEALKAFQDGIQLTSENRWFESINRFDDAIAADPNYAEAYAHRGNSYSYLGISQAAIDDAEKALSLNPDAWLAYGVRGYEQFIAGNPGDAIPDLSKAISINPEYMQAYVRRGKAHIELGNSKEAVDDFEKALTLTPGDRLALELKKLIGSIRDQ